MLTLRLAVGSKQIKTCAFWFSVAALETQWLLAWSSSS